METRHEFLSFTLQDDEYGLPILDVRELRGWSPVRKVPNSPDYFKGVWEIRGEYLPIIDLKMRLGLGKTELTDVTVVVVLSDGQGNPFGIMVDAVSEVYPLSDEAIKAPPKVSMGVDQRFIRGLASVQAGHLILLNMEALLDVEKLSELTQHESWV